MKSIHQLLPKLILGLALLCTTMGMQAFSQTGKRGVTFSKMTVQEGVVDPSSDLSGLRLRFDISFSWEEDEFFNRSFKMTYRWDQKGMTVLRSTDPGLSTSSVMAARVTTKGKSGMVASGVEVFVPYAAIPMESGPQQVEMVFSLANDAGTYTDCHKAQLSFTQKKIIRHDLNAQGFTFSNFTMDYATKSFASNLPGLTIAADVAFRYSPEESVESKYEVALVLRNAAGKVVYDSQKTASMSDKTTTLRNALKEGKPSGQMAFFLSYYDIAMDGPGEAEVVIILQGTEGGPKEIFAQKMHLNLPPQYNFEDQEFTLQSVAATATQHDGVAGIDVKYACAFKETGIMRNHDRGKYFFYAVIMDAAGKIVIAPERATTQGARTTHLQDGQLPGPDNAVAKGSLFIPLHLLNIPSGNHELKFALMVSDVNLQTKFPVIGTGRVAITKPAEVKYLVSLERLEVIPANYDSDVIGVSSPNPELQYVFAVGQDNYYQSDYDRNSLVAIPGSATLRLCEGDPIQIVLYDVDSGFFNESDLQGRWDIVYSGKGDSFYYEVSNTGQVVALRVKVSRVK